jgi:hypothetical protein
MATVFAPTAVDAGENLFGRHAGRLTALKGCWAVVDRDGPQGMILRNRGEIEAGEDGVRQRERRGKDLLGVCGNPSLR